MNTTKVIIAGLLLTGLSLSADESFKLKKENNNESLRTFKLNFRKKQEPLQIIKHKSSSVLSSSAKEWDEAEVTGSGLFINFGLHFPSKKFLNPYYSTGAPRYKLGFDFEFGSYFRFAKIEEGRFGVGLRVTWLSLSYAKMTSNKDVYRALQISALRVGPQIGYAINESMGVDAYYQWGYNFTDQFGDIDSPGNSKSIGENRVFLGGSNEVGAAFHFRVFSVGFGYRFGKLAITDYVYDGKEDTTKLDFLKTTKYSVGNFRITLGFKF